MKTPSTELLIVGSGLAGLALALKMPATVKVTIVTKEKVNDTNTVMAQGGIAAVMTKEDTLTNHIEDTLKAGAGLCRKTTVENIINQGPERINDLINWGVKFDLDYDSNLDQPPHHHLTREGGHSFRRILHFADSTGAQIQEAILLEVKKRSNIQILENHFVIELITNKRVHPTDMSPTRCVGAYIFNQSTKKIETWTSKHTCLATGGAGKVYLYTSNWGGATGDGIALAYRAGCRIANMEFMQFHPTCLYHPQSRNFLISEAMRGEGGELINHHGEPFMKKYHPMGSLAPRDIVARSIDAEIKKSGAPCVYLDMKARSPDFLKNHFPAIYKKCFDLGIDITKEPIPVVPAAHYLCGGVYADASGKTDLLNLWAIGETACTGLHGANRLASNSLLEAIAMAHNCAENIKSNIHSQYIEIDPPAWVSPQQTDEDEMIVVHHMWEEIRQLMWNYVGIVRSTKRLLRAQSRLKNILAEVRDYYSHFQINRDLLELRNLALVADLTVTCALKRKESRGIHFNLDYPFNEKSDRPDFAEDTIVSRGTY